MESEMKSDIRIQDPNKIRMLLDKYFEATITPEGMAQLKTVAKAVANGEASCPDGNMTEQLLLIDAFESYSEGILDTYSESSPSYLENKLNAHISSLAVTTSKGKHRWPKILYYSATAVVTAFIAFAGINYLHHQEDNREMPQILIASTTTPATHDAKPTTINQHMQNAQTASLTPQPATLTENRKTKFEKRKSKNENRKSKIEKPFIISEETFRVMPVGINARIETAQILVQPISTLSQSINNIYESVAAVSEALSGVSSSLEAVSNSLALISEPI